MQTNIFPIPAIQQFLILMSLAQYFDLPTAFAFYGAYHRNPTNKLIHVVCVPLIFTSSIALLSRVTPQSFVAALTAFYVFSFVYMHAKLGILYAPVLVGMYYFGSTILAAHPTGSILLFSGSWVAQFVGHGVFEKRAPALLTNLPQALHAAVFFVWLEAVFYFGFERALERQLRGQGLR